MTLLKRNELPKLLSDQETIADCRLYLFFGERYLCKEAADRLQNVLVQQGNGNVHAIDGDQEDAGQTLAKLMSFSLLPGFQIYRVSDSRLFHSKTVAVDIYDKARQKHQEGKTGPAKRYLLQLAALADITAENATPFSEIGADQWQKLFGCAKPQEDLGWADGLLREAIGTGTTLKKGGASLADKYIGAFSDGLPPNNFLILTAETVDKRQRLFTFIKKKGIAVDCSVATGASAAAQKEQKEVLREMMRKTLADFNKQIEPRALELFFDRVGFHPVAVVTETEKLALYVENRPQITCRDLEEMVGRSREDALYELTDAFSKRQLGKSLAILSRLQDNNVHGLAILATMRNYIRKLLIVRSLQHQSPPAWQPTMSANQFQSHYLPALKETGQWPELLKGHPYALFMTFSKAAEFSCGRLKQWLALLLAAEYRLKGSSLPQHIVLEELFFAMLHKSASQRQHRSG